MRQQLNPEERTALLSLARTAISDAVLQENSLAELLEATELSPAMRAARGVFVTLRKTAKDRPGGRELRGCLGNLTSSEPLYRAVIKTAPRSAVEDPRFEPLSHDELPNVRIEISALTEPSRLETVEQIVVGRDGLSLESGSRRSVFLPQVATEQRWSRERLLEELALKAGLGRDGWRKATLSAFQTEHFEE